jgi:myb proto-oncogene protein
LYCSCFHRSGSKNQTGEEDITVFDGVINSSSGHSKARKRKGTTDNNVVVQKRMRGSVSVDNEATLDRLESPIGGSKNQTGEGDITVFDGVINSSSGHSKARKRKGTTDNNVVVQKRMRGSVSVDNEATLDRLESPIGVDNEAPRKRTRGPRSVGKVTANKKTGASVSVDNEGAVKEKMRGSISVGENRPVKRRMRGSISMDSQGSTAKRKRVSR